jgi:hypothetical protein
MNVLAEIFCWVLLVTMFVGLITMIGFFWYEIYQGIKWELKWRGFIK